MEYQADLRKESHSRHILEQLHNFSGIQYIYRKCGTQIDFEFYLKKLAYKKYADYSILYLASHGHSNHFYIGNRAISLSDFAEIIGDSLAGKILHISTCETLNIEKETVQDFLEQTQLLAVSGYTKEVDFVESMALDTLYFNLCQHYKEVKSIEKKLKKDYQGLVKKTGFKLYHR